MMKILQYRSIMENNLLALKVGSIGSQMLF